MVRKDTVAKALCHAMLQALDFLVSKFDDLARIKIDQVIMMLGRSFLITRPAVPK